MTTTTPPTTLSRLLLLQSRTTTNNSLIVSSKKMLLLFVVALIATATVTVTTAQEFVTIQEKLSSQQQQQQQPQQLLRSSSTVSSFQQQQPQQQPLLALADIIHDAALPSVVGTGTTGIGTTGAAALVEGVVPVLPQQQRPSVMKKVTPRLMHRTLLEQTGNNGAIIPAPEGDGNCEEDLTEMELIYAQRFQKWFVETFLGGKYIELSRTNIDSPKYEQTLDLFDEFDVNFDGYLDNDEISNLELVSGQNLSFLDKYVPCLFQDNLLDENELLKAVCVGEPHFTTWQGSNFDYHGACDLVLYSNKAFDNGRGIDLHIRTEQITGGQYSFVSHAALRLKNDVLEIQKDGTILLNKQVMHDPANQFPVRLGENFRTKFDHSKKCFDLGTQIQHKCIEAITVSIMLDVQEYINIKVFANMVHVEVTGRPDIMGNEYAKGLMGRYGPTRRHGRYARDGITLISNSNDYGQEWQVHPLEEPSLFIDSRYPQFPQLCIPPSDSHVASPNRVRRLGQSLEEERLRKEKANAACAYLLEQGYSHHIHKNCIFDVIATGDESTALIYGSW